MILEYYISKFLKKARCRAIKSSKIDKTSKVESGSSVLNSSFGRHSYCGYNCTIINTDVGSFCSISDNVLIGPASHSMNWLSTSPVFVGKKDSIKKKYSFHLSPETERTIIGNDVWIGEGVKIKAGIKIGNGAVIGMGSIVTKDVGDYEVYGGNPAKLLKKRFKDEIIEELKVIKWWEFEDKLLYKFAPYVIDVEEFIKEVKKK